MGAKEIVLDPGTHSDMRTLDIHSGSRQEGLEHPSRLSCRRGARAASASSFPYGPSPRSQP
eukprot:1164796-Pyramimonas_sp.AAC.2